MRKSTPIFLGLLGIFLVSWLTYVLVPYIQLGRLSPDVDETTHDETPAQYAGWAEQGRVLYAANGCVTCHTQQVGSRRAVADLDRGWGGPDSNNPRRTVARDYLRDRAPYLGFSRLGPDLSNVGQRRDKPDWLLQHLYEPQSLAPGSNCPPMHFLFTRHRVNGQPSIEAIKLSDYKPLRGYDEVVPTHDAKALVAYLLALRRSSYKLDEAPVEAAEIGATP